MGWGYVLDVWAGRRTAKMAVLDGLGMLMRGVALLRGGARAGIVRAGGEIAPVPGETAR